MPQYAFNNPAGAQLSPAVTTNADTLIANGSSVVLQGAVVSNAGSAWTIQYYNGAPGSGGVAVGPAITVTSGFMPAIPIRFPNGLYAVTAGTTAGSLQVAFT